MAESAALNIQVKTTGVDQANRKLKQVTTTGKRTEAQVVRLKDRFKNFGKNASSAVAAVDGPMNGVASRISALTTVATAGGAAITALALAVTGLGVVLVGGTKTLDEYNIELARTEAVLQATGFAAGVTAAQLQEEAQAIALNTLASVQGIQRAQSVLLTFNKIQGTVRSDAVKLAQDLSSLFGGTAASQATQLGKALQDPVKGITALNRVGVSFSSTQKEQIRLFQEGGKTAQAQAIIIQTLKDQIGGVGESIAKDSLAGKADTASQLWDNLTASISQSSGVYDLAAGYIDNVNRSLERLSELTNTDNSKQEAINDLFNQREAILRQIEKAQIAINSQGPVKELTAAQARNFKFLQESLADVTNQLKAYRDEQVGGITEIAKAEREAVEKSQQVQSELLKQEREERKQAETTANQDRLAAWRENVRQQSAVWDKEFTGYGSQAYIQEQRELTSELYNLQIQSAKDAAESANAIALEFAESQQDLASGLSGTFEGLANTIAGFSGEASAAYKTAFALSKGFAVAQSSLNFGLALSQALALPSDVSLAAKFASYAAVATAGGNVLNQIASVNYSGRQQGGDVNSPVMVGERGPELFIPNGNGKIVNNNQLSNGQGSGETNITIVNQTTGRIDSVERQQLTENDVVLIIKEVMPQELADPNSRSSKTLNSRTTANRRLL